MKILRQHPAPEGTATAWVLGQLDLELDSGSIVRALRVSLQVGIKTQQLAIYYNKLRGTLEVADVTPLWFHRPEDDRNAES